MQRDDRGVLVLRGKHVARVELETNGGDVWPELGDGRFGRRTRTLGAELRVGDVALMTEGETKVQAGFGRDVEFIVRHVVAEVVAPVVGEPELTRHGMPCESDSVADALRVDLLPGAIWFHSDDGCGHRLGQADIARRADRHVQHVVRTKGDVFPGVAGLRVWQVATKRDRRRRGVEVFVDVIESQQTARGRDIERAVSYRDPIWLVETTGDDDPIRLVIPVGVNEG